MKSCPSVSSKARFAFFILLAALVACRAADSYNGIHLDRVRLPPGFKIDLYADNVAGARSMVMSPAGILFVGSREAGNVCAVVDRDGDFRADEIITVVEGLNMPNGVAFRKGALYVAEVNRILRFDHVETRLHNPPGAVVVNDTFPAEKHHGWKYIAFGPDGRLYVPVGAPCNICESEDRRFATIMRMQPDGSDLEIFARGVRNSVGFDWHPQTGALWFTSNGRDWMGDHLPPDTLHSAPLKDLHFGFPYCHAGRIPDPQHGHKRSCGEFSPPAMELGSHVAALGMKF